MATCPRCGYSKLFLRPLTCEGCRALGCERCLGVYAYTFPVAGAPGVPHRVCSWDCFDRMARANIGRGLTLASSGGHWYIGSYRLVPEAASRAVRIQAENYALAERNEDAARLYEAVGMWKEAGETRRKAQRQVVTQVHVNMNDLLDQLGRMGLTATYTCPACRSPLTISPQTSTEALTKCRYCGALIHPADIIEAIDRVVGDR